FNGDYYAGHYVGGEMEGPGVYSFAEKANNTGGGLRYEGEWANDKYEGLGIYMWRDSTRYAGELSNGAWSGYGVYTFDDDRKYEGQWVNNMYEGYGVLWNGDGTVSQAGRWSQNSLVAPMQ
ncbi:MAG: hypothetical protein AB7O04_15605, partial [Hyphomonadaceae bacterium]